MDSKELYVDIEAFCKANASEEGANKYSRYFKGEHNAYGLSQPQINQKAKEIIKDNKLELKVALDLFPYAAKNGKYELISISLLIVNGLHKKFTLETFHTFSSWYSISINNWAHADTMGMYILPKFFEKKLVTINDFENWISSPYKFQRRSVPVTFIKLLKNVDNYQPLFTFLEPLMTDKEREVHQGIGWFLREAWKKRQDETEEFLFKWKDYSPRLIFQYACEKMLPNNKLKFRKSK